MAAPRPNECLVTPCYCGCEANNALYYDDDIHVICCQKVKYLCKPKKDILVKLANTSLGLCEANRFQLSSDNASWDKKWDKSNKQGWLIDRSNNCKLFFSSREMY